MPTTPVAQNTDFSRDVLGRYICNGLDEALRSTDTNLRPDARPFDLIVIGGGSFGPVLAQHLFAADKSKAYRILVLEAGPFLLPGHVQNLSLTGLGTPGPTENDPGVPRAEVWGLPWRSNVAKGFPGLAYCIGGRSLYFGGWSPRLLPSELPAVWPAGLVNDLNARYFDQASEQIGTSSTNDFIFGPMHTALRAQLKTGIDNGTVLEAIPLNQLPLNLEGVPNAQKDLFKLEAPLAVQSGSQRAGAFDVGKFSSVPLLMQAARAAQDEYGDDVKKRLMVVPNCHVIRLITDGSGPLRRVTGIDTNLGLIPLAPTGSVVLALGTIESARLALISFPGVPNIGANLTGHLRSNLTIRLPRSSIKNLDAAVKELQASALFVKGRHTHSDGLFGHFHLQITASGLAQPSTNSEAELFKAIPDFDTLAAFREISDDQIVLTIRGIGEMRPNNPGNRVSLSSTMDEYGLPRAWVTLAPNAEDEKLWAAMDAASDQVAQVFAGAAAYEVLVGNTFMPVAANTAAVSTLPFVNRHDPQGTTHHEAGTLSIGDDPATSVLDADSRFHQVANAYAVGPSSFPTVGSPNPMLTGVALARRLSDHLAAKHTAFQPEPGFTALFDGTSLKGWKMTKIKNQPGHDDPGRFILTDGTLETITGSDLGMLWQTTPTPADFVLKLEYRTWRRDDNSGVFVRFPNPEGKAGYNNAAFVGVDFGFEVQINDTASPDGALVHKTGAIYTFASPSVPGGSHRTLEDNVLKPLGQWNSLEVHVQGHTYTVLLNETQITNFVFAPGSDATHPERGLASSNAVPRFIGLQTHTGRVAFRHIQIKAL